MKECNLCHIVQDEENFYKRKDRNGEYNWVKAYCKKCTYDKVNDYQKEHPEKFREHKNRYKRNYYAKDAYKVRIIQRRYYYNNLDEEKKVLYKYKLSIKHPEMVEQVCNYCG